MPTLHNPPQEPILVLGLGNPGAQYCDTRHNLGAKVVETAATRAAIGLSRGGLSTRRFKSLWGKGRIRNRQVILALPQTYMNLSGRAAQAMVSYYDLLSEQVLVVHDDLDLEPGRIKVARKGGAGGHNGIRSIRDTLGTGDFIRLKVGIGRPRFAEPIERYVLEEFYSDQRGLIRETVDMAADCLEELIANGLEAAMQKFHGNNRQREVRV